MDKKRIGIAITVSLTALATVVLSVIAAVNKGIEKLATSKGLLDPKNKKIYHWRFGDVSYSVTGEGRPVLLVHNLDPCSSSVEWTEIVPNLSRTNTVYTIDLPGCGLSERPALTYTSYMYTQLVNDFIQDIIKRPASVVATGKSAAFVLEACCINQDRFGELILINPDSIKNFRKSPTSRTKTAVLLLKSRVIGTLIYNIMMRKKVIERKFEEKYFYDSDNISETYVDYYFEASHLNGRFARNLYISQVGRYTSIDMIRSLKTINKNIHILASAEMPDVKKYMKEYQYYNPAIEVEYIDFVKELPQLEAPEEILKYINIYLYHH